MALLWADNFQTYGTDETKLLDGVYAELDGSIVTEPTLTTDPDPNVSTRCLSMETAGDSSSPYAGCILRMAVPGALKATVGMSARIWFTDLPNDTTVAPKPFVLIDTNGTRHLTLFVNSDGRLSIYRGPAGWVKTSATLLATSTLPVITAGAWNHIEFKATIDNSSGATEVRVNGVEVAGLTLSGTDTQNSSLASVASIAFENSYSGGTANPDTGHYYVKDFILWDTTGSQNNDFLGSCHVYTLQLDGDTSFNWDASTGSTGYNLIDELTPDDADYISADNTPPAASEFTFENLPADIVSVKGLLTVARMRKTDGGDGQVQMGVKSNGSTDSGADRTITSAFTYWWDVSELSADTASAYTPTEVNAATVTIDRTV